jgi:hypothetical protein
MANNYYDATGVLVLDRVTPVISALFGRFRLDPTYPGDGKAYIVRISESHVPQWKDVLLDLIALAAELDLPVPSNDCEAGDDGTDGTDDDDAPSLSVVLDLLASHFGAQQNTELLNLIEHAAFEDDADLDALFLIATCFDDGHKLVAIEFEGCWHCSKPRLFEFGGAGLFLSRELSLFRGSSTAMQLGQALRTAIVANDPAAAATLIAKEAQGVLDAISDYHFRARVADRVAALLAADASGSDRT